MARKLLLDANLTVLLVVGRLDVSLIPAHKRLQTYQARDYSLLLKTLASHAGIVFTPNILTEASNLLRQDREPRRSTLANILHRLVERCDELYVASRTAMEEPRYRRLGLSDAAMLIALRDGSTLLTSDADLYVASVQAGHLAINFNHLRAAAFGL